MKEITELYCPCCRTKLSIKNKYCSECGFNINELIHNSKKLLFYGKILIEKGQYEMAETYLKLSCRLKDDEAMYCLGKLYELLHKSSNLIDYCMANAARLGNNDAKIFLANSKSFTEYVEENNIDNDDEYEFINSLKRDHGYLEDILLDSKPTKSIIKKQDILERERIRAEKFYKMLDKVIEYYRASITPEEEIIPYDDDSRRDEIHKREANNRISTRIKEIIERRGNPYFAVMKFFFPAENEENEVLIGPDYISDGKGSELVYWHESDLGKTVYDDANNSWKIFEPKKRKDITVKLLQKTLVTFENEKVIKATETYNDKDGFIKTAYDDYLLEILDKKHSEESFTNIISTIQMDQNKIIAFNPNENLIMQGCAGCGKSIILLNRAKYFVSKQDIEYSRIKILTPSKKFNEFIYPVISSLNIKNIETLTMSDFYSSILSKYFGYNAILIKNKNSGLVLNRIERHKWDELFKENNYYKIIPLKIVPDNKLLDDVPNYIYSDEFYKKLLASRKAKIKNLTKKTVMSYVNEKKQIDILEALLPKSTLALFPKYDREFGVIHQCELYALLLIIYSMFGRKKIHDKKTKPKDIDYKLSYVLFDEAQDLSPNEFRLIHSIFPETKINIFGDINQRLNDWGIRNWKILTENIGSVKKFNYKINYRNTDEIIQYVKKECKVDIKSIGYQGNKVMEINLSQLKDWFSNEQTDDKILICSNEKIDYFRSTLPIEKRCIKTCKDIKGIEYSTVFVIDKGLKENERYVAYTRAKNKLVIVRT